MVGGIGWLAGGEKKEGWGGPSPSIGRKKKFLGPAGHIFSFPSSSFSFLLSSPLHFDMSSPSFFLPPPPSLAKTAERSRKEERRRDFCKRVSSSSFSTSQFPSFLLRSVAWLVGSGRGEGEGDDIPGAANPIINESPLRRRKKRRLCPPSLPFSSHFFSPPPPTATREEGGEENFPPSPPSSSSSSSPPPQTSASPLRGGEKGDGKAERRDAILGREGGGGKMRGGCDVGGRGEEVISGSSM